MKKCIITTALLIFYFFGMAQTSSYENYPVYEGNDLGLTYSPAQSTLRIWAPTAAKATLFLYHQGAGDEKPLSYAMQKSNGGTWVVTLKGDQLGKFYTFQVQINNKWMNEVTDPYAKAAGVNGKRAMIINLPSTNPSGWEQEQLPAFNNPAGAVIYELHVRDASISPNSGIQQKGKFLGLTELGTKNPDGELTGLSHLLALGVTHVHLLPSFDFYSVDETKPNGQYNWGYDPLNFNIPEGSYSTNPYDGVTRIKEFKQLIKTMHDNGIRVIMDVVYNHTRLTETSNFNQLVPGYYYRQTKDGAFSNATACGNETASERPMFRKFMLESVKYWVEEYHIDGFRFDLMGVHDIETMNLISKELHRIKPDILLYGEGWTAGASPLPDSLRALKTNVAKLNKIAVFSDDIRDGIKGSVFDEHEKGFVSGNTNMEESIKFGVVASCQHPQINYAKVNYDKAPYATAPTQVITYCSCHDNHTLWDKLAISANEATESERINMQKLALSIVLTSQGTSFLHAGAEFLRSKKGVENSFESPDSINAIDWNLKSKNKDVFEYVKGLIKMRKEHPAFSMISEEDIAKGIIFRDNVPEAVVSYTIDGHLAGDSWDKIQLFYNGSNTEQKILIAKDWQLVILNNSFTTTNAKELAAISLAPYSCTIFYQ